MATGVSADGSGSGTSSTSSSTSSTSSSTSASSAADEDKASKAASSGGCGTSGGMVRLDGGKKLDCPLLPRRRRDDMDKEEDILFFRK